MTEDRDRRPAETLDVPVTRIVGPSGGRDRRNRLAALAVVLFALSVVALALPGARRGDAAAGSPRPGDVAAASPPVGASALGGPSSTPSPRPRRSPRPTPTIPPLPSIATQPLPDAPRLAFYKRTGDDVEILAWTSGRGSLEAVGRVEGVLAGIGEEEPIVMTISPDGRGVFIQSYGSFVDGGASPVVLADLDRGVLWATATSETGQPVWSADSRRVVFATGDRWFLIDTAPQPVAVTETRVAIVRPDGPTPVPSPGGPLLPSAEVVPLGISGDGRWAYGTEATMFPQGEIRVRVDLETGESEVIEAIPRTGPAAPPSGYGLPVVDPTSGRYVPFDTVGSESVTVYEDDGSPAFSVEIGRAVQAVLWLDDGRLTIIDGGDEGTDTSFRIHHVRPDGTAEAPVFELQNVPPSGTILNDPGDHVIVVIVQDRNDRALLVMVRLVDGATSTLNFDLSDVSRIHGIGWLNPAED